MTAAMTTTIDDGLRADLAWREGDLVVAIEAADRALARGDDPDCQAAGVAAAAAAVDGALFDAADRWRGIASTMDNARGAHPAGRPWEAAALCGAAASRLTDPAAVREVLSAGRALRAMISTGDTKPAAGGLSTRERSVAELLLDGLTQKEIGARLYISPKTVEQHVARLRQKFGAANRAELIAALRSALG